MNGLIERQQHGYRNGHQLLTGSIRLSRPDQDLVDRLSDISGPLRPGQQFDPYLTGYPLPSGAYYVLAKTWQDRDAPRSGCVLTQSVFLTPSQWESVDGIRQAFALLSHLAPQTEATTTTMLVDADDAPFVSDERLPAIVEALFLEDRQPIVVFDVRSASPIIERLLTSLWPSARRNFAICSFALGPRKVGGRDFDLVFVPNDARTRFAEFKGRKIESNSTSSVPRHRWTEQITKRIFGTSEPSLSLSSLPAILRRDDRNDESILRLALLWEELAQRAPVSKTAALGMLDILNSQGVALEEAPELEPILKSAIEMAASSTDQVDAWSFLVALAMKVEAAELKKLSDTLTSAAAALTHRDATASLASVSALRNEGRQLPAALLKGLGNGLALEPSTFTLDADRGVPTDLIVSVLAVSPNYAHTFLSRSVLQNDDFIEELSRAIAHTDIEKRRDVRRNALPSLKGSNGARLLEALLANATASDVLETLHEVIDTTNLEQKHFDLPLINAAVDADVLIVARENVWRSTNTTGASRFILRSLRPEEDDVRWLAGVKDVDRRTALVIEYVGAMDHHDLIRLLRHSEARDDLVSALAVDPERSASSLLRILTAVNAPIVQTAELGSLIWQWLSNAERTNLAARVLERSLRESSPQDWPATDAFFKHTVRLVPPHQLAQLATPVSASAALIGHNLTLFTAASMNAKALDGALPELTERLTARRRENLGAEAYSAWAELFSMAEPGTRSTVRAAATAFEHVIRLAQFPVSPVILATFPVFYHHLPTKKSAGLFLAEFDRRKSARSLLVDSYMQSSWPPADLILCALEADIADKIVGRIARSYRSGAFVNAIQGDVDRLEPKKRKAVLRALAEEFDYDY